MNILVTINKTYVKQLNVLLNSIQYSNENEKFDIYILHRDLNDSDIKKIGESLDLKNFKIIPILINDEQIDLLPVYEKRYPVEIYFRIFSVKYLPKNLDRILYLDADTIVINKLKELYEMDFENNYFIATTHIKKVLHKFNELRLDIKENEPYINSGVLLMNLEDLRKTQNEGEIIDYIKNNQKKLMLPDQDIISALYGKKIKLVDEMKYNLGDKGLVLYNLSNPTNTIGLKWIYKNTVIIHYYGKNKPWNSDYTGKLGCFYNKIEKKIYSKSNNRVLILSCGTGGGHNSAAKAIQENLIEKNVQADFIEYLDVVNVRTRDRINNLYLNLTLGNGKIFKGVYHLGEIYQKTKLKSPVYTLNSLSRNKLYRYIVKNNYKYIVTTHLFAAQALTAIKKEHPISFMTIATDYVSIPFWEETNPDYFVIPSKKLEGDFERKGIDKSKILPLGIPVSKKYSKEYEANKCKLELGLKEKNRYILILNGSMGFGNVTEVVKNLLKNIENINFLISCGNNKKLLKKLQEMYKDNKRVITIPYTDELEKYMAVSEIILTKPGGLTTTEVATMRKPCIHTMPIPGCENYNANFFNQNGMALKCDTIEEIVQSTKKLLEDKELQKQMIENQNKYVDKNACDKISDVIITEIDRRFYERSC